MNPVAAYTKRIRELTPNACILALAIALALQPCAFSQRKVPPTVHARYEVIYAFPVQWGPPGSDPFAYVIPDSSGNLYGTTLLGGQGKITGCPCGVVFKVNKTGHETVLYNFNGIPDGAGPWAGVIRDAEGNFYGTTASGGTFGYGTAFKLDKNGKETVLHSFAGGSDGAYPAAALVRDDAGDLYGTTMGCTVFCGDLWGKIFKLDKTGKETVLHSFSGGADGALAVTGLIRDAAGNLFGATSGGGSSGSGGVVYKVDAKGKFSVLYSFTGGNDGNGPGMGHLIQDSAGNLYGATQIGGDTGSGVVFKVDPHGKETVLYSFKGGYDWGHPTMPLVRDSAGNLYGSTYYGGGYYACGGQAGCGTIFKIDTKGVETVLHRFRSGTDGANPLQGLVADNAGHLYGTTQWGGVPSIQCGNTTTGCGTVFKITLGSRQDDLTGDGD